MQYQKEIRSHGGGVTVFNTLHSWVDIISLQFNTYRSNLKSIQLLKIYEPERHDVNITEEGY